jgi:hypothetical protein
MLSGVTNTYGWEVAMGNEHKQHEAPEREQPRQPHEKKPQTWKHPDDGTGFPSGSERPLKP